MIIFNENKSICHIKNSKISYILEVVDKKYLVHRYFGKKIRNYNGNDIGITKYFKRGYSTSHELGVENLSFDDFPFEYPVNNSGDFRIPALEIEQENGVRYTQLLFKEWKILDKKPEIKGLPSLRVRDENVETLEIICEDNIAKIRVYLYYSIFGEKGIITRHQKIENYGEQDIKIENIQSFSLELPIKDYEMISLYGTHIKEANIERFKLHHGVQKISSTRGSSSAQHQPFFALVSPKTSNENGEVYAFHLIYSGNFLGQVEMDQFKNIRAQLGINPETFSWNLRKNESFFTPEAVLNYSDEGLNGMSQNFHWLYRNHLLPKKFIKKERPILLNSWESMYYDVSLDKIEEQCELAKELGIELFVLDDGWFRKENSSKSSMGDWICNEKKLHGGIEKVADLVKEKGLKFGLWFEPEAIGKNSDLYRNHPEWILQFPEYMPLEGRSEYILDLTREDVQSFIIDTLDSYLKTGKIDYVKWDMNRPLTDVYSLRLSREQKQETYHRYVLGLYAILNKITQKYPDVLFEGCSSGGNRFDPGILYYMGQNWTSDNTDACDRTTIQNGYSLLYHPVMMGAHVSIVPNHQTGRVTSLNTRYEVARLFNLGYELDLKKCNQEEREIIKNQIKKSKNERNFIQNSEFYRYDIPSENFMMWSVINEKKDRCSLVIFQKSFNPLESHTRFKINYLEPEYNYLEVNSGIIYGGDELINIGLTIPLIKEDFYTFTFEFIKIKD